ncbi:MAG TPA: FHA domain-containing protein [Planctomycetota bacterium]|nr:FHA domain-containing protein [Planctomycetota bacterium]
MAQLFVLSGPDVGRSFDVRSGDTIGRSPECIVTLKDPSVSRNHARLVREDERWVLLDQGSRNGIVTAGVRRTRVELEDQMEVQLGEVLLRFRAESAPESAPTRERAPPPAAPRESTIPPAPSARPPASAAPAPPRPSADVPAFARAAPAPPPIEEPDEILLEGASRIAEPTPGERKPRATTPGPLRPGPGDRVLQYNRIPDRPGRLASDLAQYPAWVRIALLLLALALAAAIAWVAFAGAAFLRQKLAG